MHSIRNSFYVTQGWMVEDLGLNGRELQLYAIIYGFSRDDAGKFYGSLAYICKWLGTTNKNTVTRALGGLIEKGLIRKDTVGENGTSRNYYSAIIPKALAEKLGGAETVPVPNKEGGRYRNGTGTSTETVQGTGTETVPNTYISKKELDNKEHKERLHGQTSPNVVQENAPPTRLPSEDAAVAVDKIPYKEIQDLYNSICGETLPKVLRMTDGRRKTIAARWKAEGKSLDTFKTVFEKAAASDFLTGHGARGWVASFDWLLKPEKFAQTLEGKYDNHGHKTETKGDTHHDEQQQLQQQAAEFQELNRRSAQRMRERLERARALQAERERASTAGGVHEHHPI